MFVLFEEAGKFMAGRVLSEAEASAQVELDSGKRVKVKAANILIKFEKPAPAELMAQAARRWRRPSSWSWPGSSRPRTNSALPTWRATISAPTPRWRSRPARCFACSRRRTTSAAPARGVSRRRRPRSCSRRWPPSRRRRSSCSRLPTGSAELGAGRCPQPIREQLYKILFKPDKNAPEYKAVVEASRATHLPPLELLQQAGAIDSPYQFHWKRFLLDNFPKGTGFPAVAGAAHHRRAAAGRRCRPFDRRLADHRDRRRAVGAGPGQRHRGAGHPHRRAGPGGAARQPDRPAGARRACPRSTCRATRSPCCPTRWCRATPCRRGATARRCRCMSRWTKPRWRSRAPRRKLERVPIAANLRHDQLDAVVTDRMAGKPGFEHRNGPSAHRR